MEENKRFSWTDLFIKVILAIIFVLFAVWLVSLSNKKVTNSLDVLTDDVFIKNIERMKEVGKEYFTTERLPQKIGEIKTLTLKEMYEKKLILEVKNKNGKACSQTDSYVSIEKMDNEYQMKVYLDCDDREDYIIVIMGCYDYCDSDICEKKEEVIAKNIEYEYKKTTGGYWTDYGSWSEWSKIEVTGTSYRQIDTKIVDETYTYDKVLTKTLYSQLEVSCPNGYVLNSDKTQCYKVITNVTYKNPECPVLNGYTLTGRNGFTCTYSKTTTATTNPECPVLDGYTLTGRNGFTCNYSKTTSQTTNPVCPNKDGWDVSRDGFTCNYSKSYQVSYEVEETYADTCYSSKVVIPCDGCAPVTQRVPYTCTKTRTVTKYKTQTDTTTGTASCPSGYEKNNGTCVKTQTDTTTSTASCPLGYEKQNNTCTKTITNTSSKTASCPSGYEKEDNRCVKETKSNIYKNIITSCPSGYEKTSDLSQCYKNENYTVKETGTKKVTYYRYRLREYIGGTTDYKWSTSNNDKNLLNAGYTLTGRTR